MRKGVVLEVSRHTVTVLTPEGEFLQTRKLEREYTIGQEIVFSSFADQPRPGSRLSVWKGRAALIAAILLFVITAAMPVYQSNQIAAYMSIDVNPSIELGLNNELLVVTLEAYNKEGEDIISGLSGWRKEKAAAVAEEILDSLRSHGYLKEDKQVLIGAVDSLSGAKANTKFSEEIAVIQQKEQDLEMTVVTGTISERESAVNQGITTAVYKREIQKGATAPVVPVQEDKETDPAPVSAKQQPPVPEAAPATAPEPAAIPAPAGKNKNAETGQPPAQDKTLNKDESTQSKTAVDQTIKQEQSKDQAVKSNEPKVKVKTEEVREKKESGQAQEKVVQEKNHERNPSNKKNKDEPKARNEKAKSHPHQQEEGKNERNRKDTRGDHEKRGHQERGHHDHRHNPN